MVSNPPPFPTCSIVPYIGTESLPGQSCKHIKDELCAQYLPSGVYWVNVTEKCFGEKETMPVSEAVEGTIHTVIHKEHSAFYL